MQKRIIAAVLWIMASTPGLVVEAAELHVGPGQAYATIMDAVSAAAEGDIITVHDNGTTPDYQEEIVINTRNLTLREAAGNDVAIKSLDYWGTVILVTANQCTIEGFDIYATLDVYSNTSVTAIHISSADSCMVRNIRAGWEPEHKTQWGVHLNGDANYNTVRDNIFSYNQEVGICLHGSDYNIIANNVCNNMIDFYGTEAGIITYSSLHNTFSGNTCNGNPRGITINYLSHSNAIVGNTCNGNTHEGIYLFNGNFNALTNNTVTDNHDGIFLSYGYTGFVAGNTIANNTNYGIHLRGNDNYCYLNCFSGNAAGPIHIQSGSGNVWNSPTKLSYFPIGPVCKNYLGNHYSDHVGTDADGDGIGDAPYVGATFTDDYPLMETSDNYTLETWFLNDPLMNGDNFGDIHREYRLEPEGTMVWVADQAALIDETFLAGEVADQTCWTYQLFVEYGVQSGVYLAIRLGHANEDGSDFTSVGGNPSGGTLVQDGWYLVGTLDNTEEFVVPADRYLALQIENTHTYYTYAIAGGACWSYISASYPSPSYPVGFSGSSVEAHDSSGQPKVLLSVTPNPFSSHVRFEYELPRAMPVGISIHDATGRRVRTIREHPQQAGQHVHVWDGRDDAGRPAESGNYYYSLNGAKLSAQQRILLIR